MSFSTILDGKIPIRHFPSGEGYVYIHWRKMREANKDGIAVRWFDMNQYRFANVTTISEGKSRGDIVTYSHNT